MNLLCQHYWFQIDRHLAFTGVLVLCSDQLIFHSRWSCDPCKTASCLQTLRIFRQRPLWGWLAPSEYATCIDNREDTELTPWWITLNSPHAEAVGQKWLGLYDISVIYSGIWCLTDSNWKIRRVHQAQKTGSSPCWIAFDVYSSSLTSLTFAAFLWIITLQCYVYFSLIKTFMNILAM